jgi:hypothetical protein
MQHVTKKGIVPKIMLDMHLTPISGMPLHCFIADGETKARDGGLKMSFSVSENNFSEPRLSSLLGAFELRVEIRFPV